MKIIKKSYTWHFCNSAKCDRKIEKGEMYYSRNGRKYHLDCLPKLLLNKNGDCKRNSLLA